MSKIQHIRLCNGDEIFGSVEHEDEVYVIYEPLISTEIETTTGSAVVLVSYLPFAKPEHDFIEVSADKIISCVPVHPIVERHYELSLFNSKKAMEKQLERISKVNEYMVESMLLNEIEEDETIISTSFH